MTPDFSQWLIAFAITCAVEIPIYTAWLFRRVPRWWMALVAAFAFQVATHPALWYVFPYFEPYWAYVTVAETCVVLVEAALVVAVVRAKPTPTRAIGLGLAASFTANAASTAVGFLRYWALGEL